MKYYLAIMWRWGKLGSSRRSSRGTFLSALIRWGRMRNIGFIGVERRRDPSSTIFSPRNIGLTWEERRRDPSSTIFSPRNIGLTWEERRRDPSSAIISPRYIGLKEEEIHP